MIFFFTMLWICSLKFNFESTVKLSIVTDEADYITDLQSM